MKVLPEPQAEQLTPAAPPPRVKLGRSRLSYSEVLAQSVSVIAPSTVPAAVLGLIYARAGNATWLSFALGTVGLLFVSLNINQFARRSASPGSLYNYVVQGLGPTAGFFGAWTLLFGYTLTGMSTLCGFSLIANVLLKQLGGVQLPIVLLFAVAVVPCFTIAFRDIQLSARTMLLFEGLSLLFVLVLGAKIWAGAGFAIDGAQLTLKNGAPKGALAGVVLVVFAFSGFESSTALGDEAKDPLRLIPRSVIQSVLVAGLFFMVSAYVVVLGFARSGGALASSEAPLNALGDALGWRAMGVAINLGILMSFCSCTLASINSAARLLFAMSGHGVLPTRLNSAHLKNGTPHVAVALTAALTFGVPAALYCAGIGTFQAQGIFGTLCSFGFIVVYILISIAAPVYLKSLGKLSAKAVGSSVGAVAFMLLALLGTLGINLGGSPMVTIDRTGTILLGVFSVYLAVGLGWLQIRRARHPKMIAQMRTAAAGVELEFARLRESEAVLRSQHRQQA